MHRFPLIAWDVEAEPVAFHGPATALPNAYAAVRCCGLHFVVEICCDLERLGRGTGANFRLKFKSL
ncbi:hypothetical protein GFM44_36575 [Rhizobium leguminosarum bv. viciae]|nr:hypothetical protein [Rhizobium leguminosarum bv. viciae]